MKRYIDADKIKYHKLSVCEGHGLNFEYTVAYKHEVDAIATAEVAPKNEVERLEHLRAELSKEVDRLKDDNKFLQDRRFKEWSEVRQEVAKEICSDLKKLVRNKAIYPSHKDAYGFIGVDAFDGIVRDVLNKYLEGEKDG